MLWQTEGAERFVIKIYVCQKNGMMTLSEQMSKLIKQLIYQLFYVCHFCSKIIIPV